MCGNGEIRFCFPFSPSNSHIDCSQSVTTAAFVCNLCRGQAAALLPIDKAAVQLEGGGRGTAIDERVEKVFDGTGAVNSRGMCDEL